jgi:hypothetical protein
MAKPDRSVVKLGVLLAGFDDTPQGLDRFRQRLRDTGTDGLEVGFDLRGTCKPAIEKVRLGQPVSRKLLGRRFSRPQREPPRKR